MLEFQATVEQFPVTQQFGTALPRQRHLAFEG
jgi:hypothetical protein